MTAHRKRRRHWRTPRGGARFSATSPASTPNSSVSRRAKPTASIRSNGYCSRSPSRRSSMPASRPNRSGARQTGVFAGACVSEYGYMASRDLGQIDAWTGTGGALSIIANRLSYFLDLRGPSLTVDTACSSSLVAVHLACQSLRTGQSELAIAAGVNLLLSPAVTRSFDAAEAMSPTGACHAFDAAADGFVRGEGCGVAVLKRLSDALRDGDRVLAVVRGSAVNQDGRSNGLMAPNPAAQAAVLARRLRRCGRPALRGRLRRGARNRNVARRPHRSPRSRGGVRARTATRTRRCWPAPSRPTSATWRRPRASSG